MAVFLSIKTKTIFLEKKQVQEQSCCMFFVSTLLRRTTSDQQKIADPVAGTSIALLPPVRIFWHQISAMRITSQAVDRQERGLPPWYIKQLQRDLDLLGLPRR